MDFVRSLLNRSLFISIQGMTFPTWVRMLWDNRARVHPLYWPRALVLTVTSLLNSAYAFAEFLVFSWFVRRTKVESPIIILGHFRGGTTHLHNLLTLDDRFAYPTLYQTLNPSTFLSTEFLFRLPNKLLLCSHRPQDRVAIGPDLPAEDEVAMGIDSLLSPYMGWVFPNRQAHYDRFLTFDDATEAEKARWKRSIRTFLQKVSWKTGKPLVLKSPPHTARIALLLELFPDARFIHIHRDPFQVFQSTRRLLDILPPYFAMQPIPADVDRDEQVIDQYARMYAAYFRDLGRIPPGQFCEVAYEDLDRDPVGTMGRIYGALKLGDFGRAEPAIREYLGTLRGFRKNGHADLPEALKRRIVARWRGCFEAWGYPIPAEPMKGPHRRTKAGAERPARPVGEGE
ncbi:MAG: sulfotransferase [Isosphaeraceae bacterium]